MADQVQSFENHGKFVPLYHFFTLPVLLVHVIIEAIGLFRNFGLNAAWSVLVAVSLLLTAFYVRVFCAGNQDRIIRLEERMRLREILPVDMHGSISKLTTNQLIGLRFASDGEVVELVKTVLNDRVDNRTEIKKKIKVWRADHQRI